MLPDTHLGINASLCGKVVRLSSGRATVEFDALDEMSVDAHGLTHGGFVFGLADYAAMLAVNDPNVVLGAASVRFLAPVQSGECVTAEAVLRESRGRKRLVDVHAHVGDRAVFQGEFTAFVLDHHVLERAESSSESSSGGASS